MAWVTTRLPCTSQPQDGRGIDRDFPLVPLALVNAGVSTFNLADNSPLLQGVNAVKTYSQAGSGIRQTSGNSHLHQTGKSYPSGNFTAVWSGVFLGAAAGSTPQIIALPSSTSTQDTGLIGVQIFNSTDFRVIGRTENTGFYRTFSGSKSTTYGGVSTIVGAVDVDLQEVRLTVFQDGLITSYASSFLGGLPPTVTGTEIFVLGPDLIESPTRHANAIVSHGAIYAGAIGAEFERRLAQNPYQVFEPEEFNVWIDDATEAAPPGTTTGTLSATETGSDTAVLSGQIVVTGTLSASDTGQDTASIAGKVIVTGTLAATETGSDTAALNGSAAVTLTGTLAATEVGSDTATLTGKVLVQGTLSATEVGSDTALINGSSVIITTGTLNAQEQGGDTAAMTGKLLVQALIDAVEQGADTGSMVGQIVISGVLAASEVGSDTAAIYSTEPVLVIAGALTRPIRLQTSGRARNVQVGVRARR